MLIKTRCISANGKTVIKEFDVSYVDPYYLLSETMYGEASFADPQVLSCAEYARLENGEAIEWDNGSTLELFR